MNDTAEMLRLEGVSKSFPGVKALSGIDLTVPAGHTCALVGRTGSGKSTLASLLSRAVEPELDSQEAIPAATAP